MLKCCLWNSTSVDSRSYVLQCLRHALFNRLVCCDQVLLLQGVQHSWGLLHILPARIPALYYTYCLSFLLLLTQYFFKVLLPCLWHTANSSLVEASCNSLATHQKTNVKLNTDFLIHYAVLSHSCNCLKNTLLNYVSCLPFFSPWRW